MKIISFSEARNSLKTVLDQVTEDADYTIITRRDADDDLLKSPANAAHLERSIAQFKQGKVVQRDLLNE
ncbi:MAG: hypothetical protein RLZZ184_218 [Cyanobacteriota bacterium]